MDFETNIRNQQRFTFIAQWLSYVPLLGLAGVSGNAVQCLAAVWLSAFLMCLAQLDFYRSRTAEGDDNTEAYIGYANRGNSFRYGAFAAQVAATVLGVGLWVI